MFHQIKVTFYRLAHRLRPLFIYAFPFVLLANLLMIFFYAPEEKGQGLVQKIFYWHVSSAFCMYIGFLIAGFCSLMYLIKRSRKWDAYAYAGVSTGLVFCTMVLISGPIWAKPIWGAWWTWDPRLTTTFLIWLIFISVVFIRKFFNFDARGKVFSAVLCLLGVLDIPLIFFAVKLWRGVHPSVIGEENSMPFEMKLTLIFSNITLQYLFAILFYYQHKRNEVEERVMDRLYPMNG